ncbi:MAG TPA: terminase family protein [Longimicrobium sp.]|uniref:DNA-packaging protein n=1 Tax=Longimicrobium sp. TaxID=2029185 RepID=UPI002EDB4DF0
MKIKNMLQMARRLSNLRDEVLWKKLFESMNLEEMLEFDACFEAWAHEGQVEPGGLGWRNWFVNGGRGYGKTRAGAEWVNGLATQAGRPVRIALVAANEGEARAVMVEGESGILSCAKPGRRPRWEPSLGRLTWPNGSVATIYSGENPDGLRGGNNHFAWVDEFAKYAHPQETWDNLQMSLRLGPRPRALVTTTPRPIPALKRILADPRTVVTGGRTGDNPQHSAQFIETMMATYGGTRLGRQELDGELIEDVAGSLWPRDLIERCRSRGVEAEGMRRIVVGVDPPISVGGDGCGIVVCGVDAGGVGHVLEDASVSGLRPEGWARAVIAAAERWQADKVVAEGNQGGAMVESVLRAADARVPVRMVWAKRGKTVRAEPVAFLFEKGEAKFAGAFGALEDELAGMTIGGGYEGPGRSPDRADACVWALTELMLRREQAEPRVRVL